MSTNVSAKEDALGWLDYVTDVKDAGMEFLRKRGHTQSSSQSFYRFQAFIRQAKSFYVSAESLHFRSSPLNYYYSFLNIAKAYILIKNSRYTGNNSGHGIRFDLHAGRLSKQSLRIVRTGVFPEFYRSLLDQTISKDTRLNIVRLLSYCTDISYEYGITGFGTYKGAPCKLIIGIDNQGGAYSLLAIANYSAISSYKKSLWKFHQLMEEVELNEAACREFFGIMGEARSSFRFFESKKTYTHDDPNIIPTEDIEGDIYKSLRPFINVRPYNEDFNFNLMAPMNLRDQIPMNECLAIYSVMYFLGNLVRYRPDFLEYLLESKDLWVIERFIKSCPITFLLHMRNQIEGKNICYEYK